MRVLVVPAFLLLFGLGGCLDAGSDWDPDLSDPDKPPWCTPEEDPYCGTIAYDEDGPLQFVITGETRHGGEVEVGLRNQGGVAYVYSVYYQACDLEYSTASGRYFIIPPGTHCDLANTAEIKPGEEVHLFTWGLDECIQDNWGCARARDLSGGTYHIRGTFWESDGGEEFPWRGDGTTRAGIDIQII